MILRPLRLNSRWPLSGLLAMALVFTLVLPIVVAPRDASAHGGRIIVPGPPAPPQAPPPPFIPRIPSPSQPTLPKPAPPGDTPGVPGPKPTTPSAPPIGPKTPETTGPEVGSKPLRLQRPGKAKGDGSDGGWRDWWDANADALRGARGIDGRETIENPLFHSGGGEGGNRSAAARPTRKAVEHDVLPLLRWAADPKNHQDPDTVSAALLALGKTTGSPDDVVVLVEAVSRRNASAMEREAAALALGLLRRSDPAEAFDGKLLDEVRRRLFDAMDDANTPGRTRCFAALAVGLLGDQPVDPTDAFARSGRLTTRELWIRLEAERASDDVPVALLLALSQQPRDGMPAALLDGLRGLCATGRLANRSRGSLTRAHAALTLARLGDADATGLFLGVAKSRNFDLPLRRSAIIGLSILAPRLDAERRAAAVLGLSDVSRAGDPDTAGLALMSVARILSTDWAEGLGALADGGDGDETLLRAITGGSREVRSFAALGLGVAGRPAGKAADAPSFVAFREKAIGALRTLVNEEGADPDARGAACIALGVLEDHRSLADLRAIAGVRGGAPMLRADACAGIGLLGRATPEALSTLRSALGERASDDIRREAARALGLLGDVGAVPALVDELQSGASDHVLARVAVALGAIGAASAITPLVSLARTKGATDETRALAIASLGLIGDREPIPSLSRIGTDSNYLARTDALHEAMSLL